MSATPRTEAVVGLVRAINLINLHCRPINWKQIDHGYPKESRASIKAWKALDAALKDALKWINVRAVKARKVTA